MLIKFTPADLSKVRQRGDQVCVMWRATSIVVPSSAAVEQFQAGSSSPRYDVTWNVFSPEEQNHLTWGDDAASFIAFATPAAPSVGTVLQMNSRLAIERGKRYSYGAGVFRFDGDGDPSLFALANASGEEFTLGLAHGLSVNGKHAPHPNAAVSLGNRQQALFTPDTQVRVCMIRGAESGSVVPSIASGVTRVALNQRGTAVLQYDLQTNSFILTSV